jgi:hypothetical protein
MKKQLFVTLLALSLVNQTFAAVPTTTQAMVPKAEQTQIINLMKNYQQTSNATDLATANPHSFINWQTKGFTPNALMYAAYNNWGPVVSYLLLDFSGKELIQQNLSVQNKNGSTALYFAIKNANSGMIGDLIQAGIKHDTKNHWGVTPLGYAQSLAKKNPTKYNPIVNYLKSLGVTDPVAKTPSTKVAKTVVKTPVAKAPKAA